jgi:hypothetical protein
MPIQQTQDLLDEIKTPTSATTAAVEAVMMGLLSDIEGMKTQGARYGTLAGLAIMAETDADLAARMELYRQTALAMQDRVARLDALAQEIVGVFRQMGRYDAEIRPIAEAAGYTV